MNQLPEYCQIGGYSSSINWFVFDDKRLARTIAGDESPLRSSSSKKPLELVLGIRETGASCLLLTYSQVRTLCKTYPELRYPRRGFTISDFESISPIVFDVETDSTGTPTDLYKKLTKLKPKSTRKKHPTYDNSQANKGFIRGDAGKHRGLFEQGRVIFRALNNEINLDKFSLDESWCRNLRICSLVFNTWAQDARHSKERKQNPKVLDLGYTEVRNLFQDNEHRQAHHIIIKENELLGSIGQKADFMYGTSEMPDGFRRGVMLQDLLRATDKPLILLVNGEELTRNFVLKHDIDVSNWVSGVRTLLWPMVAKSDYSSQRSPPLSHFHSHSSGRHSSSTARPTHSAVYIIDIRKMYDSLFQTPDGAANLSQMAYQLGLVNQGTGMCAGNDSYLIFDIWRSMAAGLPIDEQREFRLDRNPELKASIKSEIKMEKTEDIQGDEEDWDPNNMVDDQPSVTAEGHLRDDDDDESDYGEDSD